MEMKTIVTIGPAYPYRGGQTIVEASIYNNLTQAGYDSHTVSFSLLYPKIFFPGTSQFDKSQNIHHPHQDKTYRLINSINPISWYRAYKKIKELQPVAVIFVWWMPFFGPCYTSIAWMLKTFTNTKRIFLIENFISHERRWFDLFFTKITLGLANGFITHSKHIQERVRDTFPLKKVEYTSLPAFDFYDLKRYNQAQSRELIGIQAKKVILFFGLIRKYKGLDQLIKTMPLLLKQDPGYHLLIVGECYEDIKTYEALIEENELQEHTTLVNKFIANEDVEPYFKAADLVCLPYYHGTQSGILMMAYGFKKPVIVTNVGGVAELVSNGRTGQIIENNEPSTIQDAIALSFKQMQETDFAANISSLNDTLGYKNFDQLFSDLISD